MLMSQGGRNCGVFKRKEESYGWSPKNEVGCEAK